MPRPPDTPEPTCADSCPQQASLERPQSLRVTGLHPGSTAIKAGVEVSTYQRLRRARVNKTLQGTCRVEYCYRHMLDNDIQ